MAQIRRYLRQPGDRDRGRGALRHVLRRRGLPAAPLRPPRRRHHPGRADRRPAAERPDPEDRGRAAGARNGGRWANTQENVFILLALDRYFNTYEAQTPDFVARVWLGDQYAGEATFRGRTTDYQQIDVPMAYVAQEAADDREPDPEQGGPGRLYYRLGLRYAPKDLNLPAYDAGFTVERNYEAVDDPADVRATRTGPGASRPGARVRVQLTMVAPARRYHVALIDPLPAGLEALNPALAVTGSLPPEANQPVGEGLLLVVGPVVPAPEPA